MAEGVKLEPGSDEVKNESSEAMQRHHDHYVSLDRAGELPEEERPNLDLARQREMERLVKPLAETPSPQQDGD